MRCVTDLNLRLKEKNQPSCEEMRAMMKPRGRSLNFLTRCGLWGLTLAFSLLSTSAYALTKSDLRRVNSEGPVEIAVVYLNPLDTAGSSEMSFEVRMNTHSVNLEAYDMAKLSTLRIDDGTELAALGWFEPGGGGHHISGILKFTGAPSPAAKLIRLIIREVGGVAERSFEWTLPHR